MNADNPQNAKPEDMASVQPGFIIMQQFLHAEWELFGRRADSLSDLLSFSQFLEDGGTLDPAVFRQWLSLAKSVQHGELGPIPLHSQNDAEIRTRPFEIRLGHPTIRWS